MSSPLTGFPWRCRAGWLKIDDPEFGYWLLADGVAAAGFAVAVRMVWRICSDNGWWSVFGKEKGGRKVKVPAHDDLVQRWFTVDGPNKVWLTDITEHRTGEGKLCLCAIKEVWSNRIVGCCISDRMESSIAVNALESAVARRAGEVAGCVFHSDRGGQFRSRKAPAGAVSPPNRRLIGSGRLRRRQRRHGELLLPAATQRRGPSAMGDPRRATDHDPHLDRADLPPPPTQDRLARSTPIEFETIMTKAATQAARPPITCTCSSPSGSIP